MTPPDTDLRKQTRRHRPALYAMAFVVIFAGLTMLIRIFAATDADGPPEGGDPAVRVPGQSEDVIPRNPPREPGEG